LAIATGMRQAKILGLAWTDIDLDAAQLTVRTTLQRIDGEYRFLEPKTAKSRRTLALPEIVVGALRVHLGLQIGEMLQSRYEVEEIRTGIHRANRWAVERPRCTRSILSHPRNCWPSPTTVPRPSAQLCKSDDFSRLAITRGNGSVGHDAPR
jgi:integrase